MRQGDGGFSCGKVDHAKGLAIRDVPATVGLGFFNGEVVELCITAFLSFMIESEESMA